MKTYSDLQDINTQLLVEIGISSINQAGDPTATVHYNDQVLYNDIVTQPIRLKHTGHICDSFTLTVEMSNKQYRPDLETAIIIDSIAVDNINVIPMYNHLTQYINDHDQNRSTNYLGWNGKWTLTIDRPFYQWLHQAQAQGWLLD